MNPIVTVLRLDTGLPFVEQATLLNNDDGSVSLQLPDGTYAGQEPWIPGRPSTYGFRHDGPATQAYQRATQSGNLVTFVTRPGDIPCTYLIGAGRAY